LLPPLLLELEGVGAGAAGVLLPVGVGPEFTAVAQGVEPAEAGAELVVRPGSTTTSAVSMRPWSSVTVNRRPIGVTMGAITEAFAVFAPLTAGGLASGELTVQE
jgi:hypothetical protein